MHFQISLDFEDAQLAPRTTQLTRDAPSASKSKHKALDTVLSIFQQGTAGSSVLWPPTAAAEAYDVLLCVDEAGWSSAKACKQFVTALQLHGTTCVQQLTTKADQSDTAATETSLALTTFLMCHMLQRTERWLSASSKAAKRKDITKAWVGLKASTLNALQLWQEAFLDHAVLASLGERRLACKLIWVTALQLLNSQQHVGVGKKEQGTLETALTGVLAKPFTAGSAAASGKSELFRQLLDLCLHSKQSHLSVPLTDIIAATEKHAPEVAVGMLTAVADLVLQTAGLAGTGNSSQTAQHQRLRAKASNKEAAAADLMHQQEWALLILVTFAKRGLAHCQTVLGLYFCQTAPHAMLWGSTSLRKHAMELAALQLDRFPHHAVNGQVAMQCFNTGLADKDAAVRAKALVYLGDIVASAQTGASCVFSQVAEGLAARLLDKSIMVRKAAVLAINKVLDSLQIDSQQTVSSDHSCATALIVQLTHILAAAPHSALATVDMHQAALQLMLRLPAVLNNGSNFDSSILDGLLMADIDSATLGQILVAWLPTKQASLPVWSTFLAGCSKLQAAAVSKAVSAAQAGGPELSRRCYQHMFALLCTADSRDSSHPCITKEEAMELTAKLKVLYVLPATSAGGKDATGEVGLLLDTLDLILQTAGQQSTDQQQQQRSTDQQQQRQQCQHQQHPSQGQAQHQVNDLPGNQAACAPQAGPSAEHAASEPELTEQNIQPGALRASSCALEETAHGFVVSSALAEALLWGLYALQAAASKPGCLPPECLKLATDYVIDRFVMLSRDWSLEVAEAAVQVLYSLPKPQDSTTRAAKQLQVAIMQLSNQPTLATLGSPSWHINSMEQQQPCTHKAASADEHAKWNSPLLCLTAHGNTANMFINFILLLGHMAKNYELEKARFVKHLEISSAVDMEQDGENTGTSDSQPLSSPAVLGHSVRRCTGVDRLVQESDTPALASEKTFDYMQAGNESNQAVALAQEYMEELLQKSAPAAYLPMLVHVLQDLAMPTAVKVAAMTSLGQLAVLSEQLSLQCSSAVLACLDAWPQHVAQVRVQGVLLDGRRPSMGPDARGSDDACQQATGAVDNATDHADSLPSHCGMGSDALDGDDACQQAEGAVDNATGHADSLPSHCGQLTGKTPQSLHSSAQQPVVLAAVEVAGRLVQKFPYAHAQLAEAMLIKLKQGLADNLAPDDVTRALAVAVGTLLIQEQLKQSSVMGLVAEAMVSHDQQVAQVMTHACRILLQSKTHQRYKILCALHNQAPLGIANRVCKILVENLMTAVDFKAEALVTSVLQTVLAVLQSGPTEECVTAGNFLQHLVPSQKHLTLMQRHFEDSSDVLLSCNRSTLDCLVTFVTSFPGGTQAAIDGSQQEESCSRKAGKAMQAALLSIFRSSVQSAKGQKAKRKKEGLHPDTELKEKEDLSSYAQAVSHIRTTTSSQATMRITDIFSHA